MRRVRDRTTPSASAQSVFHNARAQQLYTENFSKCTPIIEHEIFLCELKETILPHIFESRQWLIATLLLLQWTAKPRYKFLNLFRANKLSRERNWLLASVLGFGFLFLLVFLTSILADRLIGPKAVNNPIVKEILLSSDISKAACVAVYCIVTPLLEETVYRGFLLTSISSTMKWQKAVFVSSVIFSAAHFSGENFLQLSIIGCVLGCSYCWTGNLSSSIVIHSLYNALTLMLTLLS
ncbi:hypothetical protein F2P56_022474 [Juglans regia]|uniref:CAAX prenyl protease 2/Lysostaphin resistance protein A-like domain-containing protein n=1 Tax=Juglans regia TaxID=51240 RepID=A0A833U809_JUGRE|nr:hypothetical protein F2P56_022474 [Juglans regia]